MSFVGIDYGLLLQWCGELVCMGQYSCTYTDFFCELPSGTRLWVRRSEPDERSLDRWSAGTGGIGVKEGFVGTGPTPQAALDNLESRLREEQAAIRDVLALRTLIGTA